MSRAPDQPTVDINLFVHNGACTVAAAIDSVRQQSWQNWRLTLIDDGSTDATPAILAAAAAQDPRIAIKRNRHRTGAVGAFQRGLWWGDADYVMPKSADDLIAPDFVARLMQVLQAYPDTAMAHARGLSFDGPGTVRQAYPASHCLHAIDADPIDRAAHVMATYTSSPSFWGIYRRDAVDRLAPIAHRAGWDHVLLAELALYGEIRHVPELLYWRRGGGRPVRDLARAATAETTRAIPPDPLLDDPLWRTPCITTAYAHVENFAVARLPAAMRRDLIGRATHVFARRWGPIMRRELADVRDHIDLTIARAEGRSQPTRLQAHLQLVRLLTALQLLLPGADLTREHARLAALIGAPQPELCDA